MNITRTYDLIPIRCYPFMRNVLDAQDNQMEVGSTSLLRFQLPQSSRRGIFTQQPLNKYF